MIWDALTGWRIRIWGIVSRETIGSFFLMQPCIHDLHLHFLSPKQRLDVMFKLHGRSFGRIRYGGYDITDEWF